MARALLVGCGCYAREGGRLLLDRGWEVRGTSRSAAGREAIAAAGIEPAEADPDRVGTVTELVGDVTVLAWLLGGVGAEQAAAALHGPRLESALEKLVDTPVRGVVYERAAAAPDPVRDRGVELVEAASRRWHIPLVVLRPRSEDGERWPSALAAAVEGVIGPAGRSHF